MNDYVIGNIVGLTQVSVGYPFDTIKTNRQSGYSGKINFKTLLRGIKYPLVGSCLSNTLIFGNFGHFNNWLNNPVYAGAFAGFIGAFILNPFETKKIQEQLFKKNIKIKQPLFSGLNYMVLREIISNGIYFGVYNYCKNDNNLSSFISGGFAGVNSWFWTYPIDALRVRKQLNPSLNIKELINLAPLYKGIIITLIRAFLVNGCGFFVYNKLKTYSN